MTLDILNQISNFFNFFSIILCHGLVPRWEEAVFGFGGTPHFIVYNISSASGGQESQPPATASRQCPEPRNCKINPGNWGFLETGAGVWRAGSGSGWQESVLN